MRACVSVCVCVYVCGVLSCVCACVCVCVRARGRERVCLISDFRGTQLNSAFETMHVAECD